MLCTGGGFCPPSGTGSPCPGGEDHLKRRRRLRRIVPSPPVPPLLGCRHCSPEPHPNRNVPAGCVVRPLPPRRPGTSPLQGFCLGRGCKCRLRLSPGDARGEAPCIKITLVSPFPPGRGSGGWGQKRKPKAGLAGKQESKPPPNAGLAGRASAASRSAPGCRGRSPRRNKVKVSPFPAGEGGRGDRGQKRKPKAGSAGNQNHRAPLTKQQKTKTT